MKEEARKFDQGKADYSLLPAVFLEEVAKAMQYGAVKYGRFNYAAGLESSRLVAAAARHLFAWAGGKERDEESGVSHLAHVAANVLMLLHTRALGTLKDDRFVPGQRAVGPTSVSASALPVEVDEKRGVLYSYTVTGEPVTPTVLKEMLGG